MTQRGKLRNLCVFLLLLAFTACGDPLWYFSGSRLSGEEAPLVDLPVAGGIFQIETLPADPYSVNLGFTLLDGTIYIDPAEDRQWYQNIQIDPMVRIRFDGSDLVHPMLAIEETDATVLAQFDTDRIILRLEPR